MSEAKLLELAHGIAAGLAHAHAAGIIHRDLKPSNILVRGGHTPKIADFGMARATSFAGVDTQAFAILGTPDYMAPESLDPLAVDPRSDLYALGCILFEMASGRPPFSAATPFGVLDEHCHTPVPPVKGYGEGLCALISVCLAKSPADRPQSATTIVDALERLISNEHHALALTGSQLSGESTCAACGQPIIPEVGVCMSCGLVSVQLTPGPCTLLVTGPGEIGDKIDTTLRNKLVDWIEDNPGLRLSAKPMAKKIPRLPFTLSTKISESSAHALTLSIERLGMQCETVRGSPFRSPGMRTKAKKIAGRVVLILIASLAGIMSSKGTLFVAPVMLIVAAVVSSLLQGKRMTKTLPAAAPLPQALQAAVGELAHQMPAIDQPRHRHGLRAVVSRCVALARHPAVAPDIDPELAHAVKTATFAAARLSHLDRNLAEIDLAQPSDETRAMLHERDTWAARLLDLTATLDGFYARLSGAQAQKIAAESKLKSSEDPLAELRLRVESLEEIQGL